MPSSGGEPTRLATPAPARPPVWLVAAAYFSLYFFWGSTYLGIKWAIEGFPPFFLAGVRNLIAGMIVYAYVRQRAGWGADGDAGRPTARQWINAAIVGGLLLLGGNGLVTFATQYIASSVIALMVAMLPIWMALLVRFHPMPGAPRPGRARVSEVAGIALGFAGVLMLIGPKVLNAFDAAEVGRAGVWPAVGALATLASSFCWANGSLYSRRADLPRSPFLSTGMQLLCGGALLLAVSGAAGEFSELSLARMFATPRPVLSLVYLIVAGSLIGFTSYIWLLSVSSPSKVATYAYVNPVVAVGLGWWLGGEAMTPLTLVAAAVIIASVVIIVSFRPQGPGRGGTVVPSGGTLAVPVSATGGDDAAEGTAAAADVEVDHRGCGAPVGAMVCPRR